MELIDQVERDARGPYCGAIGRIGPNLDGLGDDAAFNVAIRTIRLTPGERDIVQVLTGALSGASMSPGSVLAAFPPSSQRVWFKLASSAWAALRLRVASSVFG